MTIALAATLLLGTLDASKQVISKKNTNFSLCEREAQTTYDAECAKISSLQKLLFLEKKRTAVAEEFRSTCETLYTTIYRFTSDEAKAHSAVEGLCTIRIKKLTKTFITTLAKETAQAKL